jgi:hypothetical protein
VKFSLASGTVSPFTVTTTVRLVCQGAKARLPDAQE